ncbi:MAG: NACHT domain-containing protein [Candidatus Sericytochromatia bacterium]
MESVLSNVLWGVLGNAIYAITLQAGIKSKDYLTEGFIGEKDNLEKLIQKSLERISDDFDFDEEIPIESICLYLQSSECETIIRQVFSLKLINGKDNKGLLEVKKEFKLSISSYFESPKYDILNIADLLFDGVLQCCDEFLTIAIKDGDLASIEAKSNVRFRMLHDEISSIQKNIEFLLKGSIAEIKDIIEYEKKIRQQIAHRCAHIVPPHFDSARKIPINEIYVYPEFSKRTPEIVRDVDGYKPDEFLSSLYRAVILGDPGGGKSTFSQKICYDLASKYESRLFAGRLVTPILVVLRDYGAQWKEINCSILEYIEIISNTIYQIAPPKGAIEHMLLNGRAIVIFDGLDELTDTSNRQLIANNVESFCNLYPALPVLVTSREVGYAQAPLDEKRFPVFRIRPFSDEQVHTYVQKWFKAADFIPDYEQYKKVESFMKESRLVSDIRSNPLMLALMCNIYRGENYIPQNRPDVYEKCALMLFEKWDKSRGIHVSLPFDQHIRPTMMHIAYWIYSNPNLQRGVSEQKLIKQATEYLCPKRFEDIDDAEKAAKEFIEFCRGRAWVFTDIGSRKAHDGSFENLYQFTHRTFLEYFTAAYLVRNNRTPESLSKVLNPRIKNAEWDVVAQLAFQIQNKNLEGAGDELIDNLKNDMNKENYSEVYNVLDFMARCLDFMVPSPVTTRIIVVLCLDNIINFSLEKSKRKYEHNFRARRKYDEFSYEIVGSILSCSKENKNSVANSIEKFISEHLTSEDLHSDIAWELGSYLSTPLGKAFAKNEYNQDNEKYWKKFSYSIMERNREAVLKLCNKSFRVALGELYRGRFLLKDLVHLYGVEGCFKNAQFVVFDYQSDASILIKVNAGITKKTKALLEDFAVALMSLSTPLYKKDIISPDTDLLPRGKHKSMLNLKGNSLFGLMLFYMILFEREEKRAVQFPSSWISMALSNNALPELLKSVLFSRLKNTVNEHFEVLALKGALNHCQKELILNWLRRDIQLAKFE